MLPSYYLHFKEKGVARKKFNTKKGKQVSIDEKSDNTIVEDAGEEANTDIQDFNMLI